MTNINDPKTKKYNNPFTATLTGIRDLFRKLPPAGTLKPEDRLDGKIVLVDGSSSGLGYAVALDVARRGARLIMACRSGIPGKGEMIKKLSGNQQVKMLPVDFSDLGSIYELAKNIRDEVGPIDIYISNAGIVPKKSRKTPQGLEEMFMVNYFSKFVFINLLIENGCFACKPEPSRIVLVSSESHRNPDKFDWDGFGIYRDYSIGKSIELYGYYKLLLTTFSVELSRRINADEAVRCSVFALCPGPVNSNIAREAPLIFQPLLKLVFSIFFRSPARAAIPVVYLAASPDQKGKPYDYFFLMSRKEIDEKASNPENGKKLWDLSQALLEKLRQTPSDNASGMC